MAARKHDQDISDEEEVTDLSNPDALTKYKEASIVANAALCKVVEECKAGAKILDICRLGDKFINDAVAKKYTKIKEKGVAFPTCVSVNNIAGHFSPLSDDTTTLKEGDVAKIDLGAHYDGYIAVVAYTTVVGQTEPATGKKADVIEAAHVALKNVVQMIRPGVKNTQVTEELQKVATQYHVNLVEGVLSHDMKRFVIDGNKVVIQKPTPDQRVEEFVFEENEVYGIDVVMSTGDGKVKESELKATVFKRAVNQQYRLKLKASRYVLNEINERFPTFPFTVRALDETRGKLGIVEMIQHNLLDPYPVLFEKQGEIVAQFKTTILLYKHQTIVATSYPTLPATKSEYTPAPAAGTTTAATTTTPPAATPVPAPATAGGTGAAKKKKNKKNKKKKKAAAAPAQASVPEATTTTQTTAPATPTVPTPAPASEEAKKP